MKPKGVNRVVIAVKDLNRAMDTYSMLLGATFHDVSAGSAQYGVRAAISWDAGIELCAPIPGKNSYVEQIIARQGEGLMGAVFCVDDVEEAHARAKNMGVSVLTSLDYDQKTIDEQLGGRFKKYKWYMLNAADLHGVGAIIAQIEPK
ncbi:MAG: VOC family protein [Dehalococcoidia bacterium]|nr:VOC family protein [Dehalococcoidia bacterium]